MDVPVVRVMSNTPVLVDEAMSVISPGAFARPEHLARAEELLRPVGKVLRIPESQQDAATALSGSGPAYVYFLVEAMVDAGILLGMPRGTAMEMVTQAVFGAATMLRETGEHPVILREAVTSPGGTTIAAIRELERHGVRAADPGRDRGGPGPGTRTGERMTCTLHVAWDDRLTSYDFGPGHPLAPVRVELTMALARSMGVLDAAGVSLAAPEPAQPGAARTDPRPRVHRRGPPLAAPDPSFGLGTPDNPIFPGMHEASAMVAGATLAAARAVWTSAALHGASPAGGLHHAMASSASGFCVYNDPAIAIAWLLGQGAERIAYVDVDAHHGDGVETAFWNDPRVLTIGLHEHPDTLFPGTGRPGDVGGPDAEGSAVNVALPAGTGDAGWLRAFHAVVPPLVRKFRPQILVSQHGCDSHRDDPLANLELTIDAQRAAHAAIHALAHSCAEGRWLLTGGGGYEHVHVVPRSWTHLLFEAAGGPLDPATATPGLWREFTLARTGVARPPRVMTDGPERHLHPVRVRIRPRGHAIDRTIMATRSAVFPVHGLFPGLLTFFP